MKKVGKLIVSSVFAIAMMFSLTGCSEEEVTLKSQTLNGVTLQVPSDFGEFKEDGGFMLGKNEDATASMVVSKIASAEGTKPSDFTKESYLMSQTTDYKDVEVLEFDQNASIQGKKAVYAHLKAKNSSDVEIELYNYIAFFDDGNYQSVVLCHSIGADSALEKNVKAIIDSIKFA